MSDKRFYSEVSIDAEEGAYTIKLDGRPVRTPARQVIRLPGEAAAKLVAEEFSAQPERVNPAIMPVTRLVNTALDGVAMDPQAVIEDIMRFAGTDLVCYRAEGPAELVARQNAQWDPVLDFARRSLGVGFVLSEGVMHVEQPRMSIAAVGFQLQRFSHCLQLAALHSVTTLTGSALLSLGLAMEEFGEEEIWNAAHVDEDWNISQWGEDEEAAERRRFRHGEMLAAARLLKSFPRTA